MHHGEGMAAEDVKTADPKNKTDWSLINNDCYFSVDGHEVGVQKRTIWFSYALCPVTSNGLLMRLNWSTVDVSYSLVFISVEFYL